MKTREEIKRIGMFEKGVGYPVGIASNIVDLARKINELIDRVNELSSPEKKEEVEIGTSDCCGYSVIPTGYNKNGTEIYYECRKCKRKCYIKNRIEKEEPTQEEDDCDYCPVCKSCGVEGCCNLIPHFIDKHIRGKSGCKYEDEYISEIEYCYKETYEVEKEEPTQEFTKDKIIWALNELPKLATGKDFRDDTWSVIVEKLTSKLKDY